MEQSKVIKLTLPSFEEEMVRKLEEKEQEYGNFSGWESVDAFIEHFVDEASELVRAYLRGEGKVVRKEAVDIANMAYMIWRVSS